MGRSIYYHVRLDCLGQRAYDSLLSGWQKLERRVLFPFWNYASLQIRKTVCVLMWDHLEFYWTNSFNTKLVTSVLRMEHICNFFFSNEEIIHWQGVVNVGVKHVISQLPEYVNAGNGAWLIYGYHVRQVEYREQGEKLSYTIVGPLMPHEHFGVCGGIALAYKSLCDATSIPCKFVTRDAFSWVQGNPHAWNIVGLGGYKRHVDQMAHAKGVTGNSLQFASFYSERANTLGTVSYCLGVSRPCLDTRE